MTLSLQFKNSHLLKNMFFIRTRAETSFDSPSVKCQNVPWLNRILTNVVCALLAWGGAAMNRPAEAAHKWGLAVGDRIIVDGAGRAMNGPAPHQTAAAALPLRRLRAPWTGAPTASRRLPFESPAF